VAVLVGDGAVEQHVVDLVAAGVLARLADEDLDLVGLHLLREDRRQRLRVGVGQVARAHVVAAVGVPAQVRVPNPADPEVLELAVLADAGERDPVVDLADLVQRRARVLGDEQTPSTYSSPTTDLPRAIPLCAKSDRSLIRCSGGTYGMKLTSRPPDDALVARRSSSSPTLSAPSAVTTTTVGKIPAVGSGPPSPRPPARRRPGPPRRPQGLVPIEPGRQRFFSELLAGRPPEPVE
jgi:hypothetical protein